MRIAKFLLFLVVTLITISSCKKEIKVNSLEEVLLNISPQDETFIINPAEEKLLTAKKGTVIYIPENAFQFEDGSTPKQEIQLEIKECYKLADMIAENLSTTSKGKILETGGMINISAISDGKSLEIRKEKAIAVGFPKDKGNKEMDLFYHFKLNDSVSTWIPDYEISQAEDNREKIDETLLIEGSSDEEKYPITISEDLYDYRLCIPGFSIPFWYLQFKNQNETIFNYMNNFPKQSDSLIKVLNDEDWYLELEANINSSGRAKWVRKDYSNHYDVDENGKFVKMSPLESYYTHSTLRNQILQYLNKTSEFDIKKYRDSFPLQPHQAKITEYGQSLSIGICKEVNQERYKKKFREQYAQYTDKAVQQMDKDVLQYYMFSSAKLGWINCDRFWDIADAKKTDYVVRVPNPKDTKIQMIFEDIKSILNGVEENGNTVFKNVPINRKVKIIGISYQNGKPTMAIEKRIIDSLGIDLKGFKEFTLNQLKERVNQQ